MGISEFTYNQHENGNRGLRAASAGRYAKKFKVSAEWLLFGVGAGPQKSPALDDLGLPSEEELAAMLEQAFSEVEKPPRNFSDWPRAAASGVLEQLTQYLGHSKKSARG